MSRRRSLVWLGLTPEPERELPTTVAALRTAVRDMAHTPAEAARAERHRVERLILRGTQQRWLRYLAEVTGLVTAVAGGRPGDRRAALRAAEVVLDHHRMLIGLPGTGYGRTAADRRALESAVRTLRTAPPEGDRA
ncbi:hypothetical protein HXP44_28160 [Streptomyces sioyaensis]|uniref:Uncharacterized protein n=1 Tax=Streptomyces sioyaensis TaxID=67364 RepID=A0A4Q1RCC6_9ACTN|nr:hypothetical protein [Streptomyces sioyaensis]MBM4795826.1 hypothetical protein [Streptomyces sioyaensis]RXS71483.1 hypothetical protein EST54_00070 [Streptomyces sioyaensis]